MPTSMAEAQRNAQTDLDVSVIDEFRKSTLIDMLPFDDAVNPSGGGATLSYSYRRLVTQANAANRKVNTEYAPAEVQTQHFVVGLGVYGGSFSVDRVLARVGPAASGAVNLNLAQKIKATRAKFSDEVINGDKATNSFDDAAGAQGFDGLSKALVGTENDLRATTYDWSAIGTQDGAATGLDQLDEILAMLDDQPGAIVGNKKLLLKIKSIARRFGYFSRTEGAAGTTIERYNQIALVDAGKKPGTNDDVIPVTTGAGPTGGITELYAVRFGLDGFHGVSTVGGQLVEQWMPDFTRSGAVKVGEVELGPAALALKATKSAVVANIRLNPQTLAALADEGEPVEPDDQGDGEQTPDDEQQEAAAEEVKTTTSRRRR